MKGRALNRAKVDTGQGLAHGVTLGDVVWSRDNNLNLIRFLAASAVLFTHSYALSLGQRDAEPLRLLLGMTPATIAVDVFFLISGFLVTASLQRKPQVRSFLAARALRILPGLLVMLLLTVFVAGPLLSTLGAAGYLAEPQVYRYFLKCASLVFGVEYLLPGVFTANPHGAAVNGSLWTLPHEVRCYLTLAVLWLLLHHLGPRGGRWVAWAATGLAAVGLLAVAQALHQGERLPTVPLMYTMFAMGSAAYFHRERLVLHGGLGAAALLLLVLLAGRVPLAAYWLVYVLLLPYGVFCLAYLPGGWLRGYNRLGDYSYGIYIYAFPVQQFVVARAEGIGPWGVTALAFPVVLLAAVLSWHGVESRALALRRWAGSSGGR